MTVRNLAVLWLCVFSLICEVEAAEKLEFGAPPDWVVPSPVPSTPTQSTPADVNFLLEDRQINLSKDGTDIYTDSIARIQSPQGLNALGTISLLWNPNTMSVTVHKLHILRGGQVIDVLADQSFTVLRREKNLELAVLDGVLTAAVQPTGLQVGDAIELSFTLRHKDPALVGTCGMDCWRLAKPAHPAP